MKILYLTPGCFDKGGISRYSRYQITALRNLLGSENVHVHSVLGPDEESLEQPFAVAHYAGGTGAANKLGFLGHAYWNALSIRPQVIWSAHVNLSGAAKVLAKLVNARTVLNVYGLEVWSGLRRDAAWGLRVTDHVVADCHWTARYLEGQKERPERSIAVVWDCVDVTRFYPDPYDASVLKKYGIPDPTQCINLLTLARCDTYPFP